MVNAPSFFIPFQANATLARALQRNLLVKPKIPAKNKMRGTFQRNFGNGGFGANNFGQSFNDYSFQGGNGYVNFDNNYDSFNGNNYGGSNNYGNNFGANTYGKFGGISF